MSEGGGGERKKTIKLFCPALSKATQLVAWEEQRLDLGSIAKTFGLDPSTLKLNGHFISRGLDLIASSVTWKSLISFFSSRGLSTGATYADALVVDGRLCRAGTKRAPDPADVETGVSCTKEQSGNNSVDRKSELEGTNMLAKKRFRNSGFYHGADEIDKFNSFSLKRKQHLEIVSSTKRIRMEETNLDIGGKENTLSGTISNTQFPCCFLGKNMKRLRDEERTTTTCKKSR
ncbi:hypothetical protein LguiB_030826 [Lonicera macranthoides]